MQFTITLSSDDLNACIPINYQYPLSAAIYRIISKGSHDYAYFLHEHGYGKGFKLFCFSQLRVPFTISGDRLCLLDRKVSFQIAFHLPQAIESFVKGLFQSERIDIADSKSKASFVVKSVESNTNPLQEIGDNTIVNLKLRPLSPIVSGLQNDKGYYDFLEPRDASFIASLVYNWRSKIATCYSEQVSKDALLLLSLETYRNPPKSRLIHIKAGTEKETKIRGWMNFGLQITAEKRFVELLLNAGAGLYNAQGMGCLEVVKYEKYEKYERIFQT